MFLTPSTHNIGTLPAIPEAPLQPSQRLPSSPARLQEQALPGEDTTAASEGHEEDDAGSAAG